MTPPESIPLTHLPLATIAALTNYSVRSVQNWKDGAACPEPIRAWLARAALTMLDDPPPQKQPRIYPARTPD